MTIQHHDEKMVMLEQIYRYLPKELERRLTIPAIFGRTYDENFISDYLAYILDPARNGIGFAPLQALASLVGAEISAGGELKIDREYIFQTGRRIDLLVTLGDEAVLGIENKIFSSEGEDQTGSYARSIAQEFPEMPAVLVYLTPQGSAPVSSSFIPLSYGRLLAAYRDIPFPVMPDIQKAVIWEDFLNHLEDYIIMAEKTLELSEKTRLYLKYQEMIDDLRKAVEQDGQLRQEHALQYIGTLFEGWAAHGQNNGAWHWYVKDGWYLKDRDTYIFAQFNFRPEDLIKAEQISFSVGIYPANEAAKSFGHLLKTEYRHEIETYCEQVQMESFPKRGGFNVWIASKEYRYHPEVSSDMQRICDLAREELMPLEAIMDRALVEHRTPK
jgi:hypothetical protein